MNEEKKTLEETMSSQQKKETGKPKKRSHRKKDPTYTLRIKAQTIAKISHPRIFPFKKDSN